MITLLRTGRERRKWLTVGATASLTTCAPLLLLAASQGNIGPSSTGNVGISLTVGHHVRVSGLDDIAFELNSNGFSAGTTSACVYNSSGGPVRLQTLGSGPGGAFTLTSSDDAIDYDLHMQYQAQPVATDSGLTLQPANHQLNDNNCLQYGPNTSLKVTTDSAGEPATVYTGTLTLMVTAE